MNSFKSGGGKSTEYFASRKKNNSDLSLPSPKESQVPPGQDNFVFWETVGKPHRGDGVLNADNREAPVELAQEGQVDFQSAT